MSKRSSLYCYLSRKKWFFTFFPRTEKEHNRAVWQSADVRRQSNLCVFLDIKGAFDNIAFDSIYEAFKKFGVEKSITNWYIYLLRNRTIFTELKGSSAKCYPVNGVPQGDILAPTVWNMALDELLCLLQEGPCIGTGFADDVVLSVAGPVESSLAEEMQERLNLVDN